MEHMSVLQMVSNAFATKSTKSTTLGADDYADSSVTKLPSHRHQRIDEGSPFREVLLEEQRSLTTTEYANDNQPTLWASSTTKTFPCLQEHAQRVL
jgi:hypothetical protein